MEEALYNRLKDASLGDCKDLVHKLGYHFIYGASERIQTAALDLLKRIYSILSADENSLTDVAPTDLDSYVTNLTLFFKHINETRSIPILQKFIVNHCVNPSALQDICKEIGEMVRHNLYKKPCPIDVESVIDDLWNVYKSNVDRELPSKDIQAISISRALRRIGTESAKQVLKKVFDDDDRFRIRSLMVDRELLREIASVEAEQIRKQLPFNHSTSVQVFFETLLDDPSYNALRRDIKLAWCQIHPYSEEAEAIYKTYIDDGPVNDQCVQGLISLNRESTHETLINKLSDPDFPSRLKERICKYFQHSEMALPYEAEQVLKCIIDQPDNHAVKTVASAYIALLMKQGDYQSRQVEEFIARHLQLYDGQEDHHGQDECVDILNFLYKHINQFKNSECIKEKLKNLLEGILQAQNEQCESEHKTAVAAMLIYLGEDISNQDLAKLVNKGQEQSDYGDLTSESLRRPVQMEELFESFIPILIEQDQKQLLKRVYNNASHDREFDPDERHAIYSLIMEDHHSVLNHFPTSEQSEQSRQHAWLALKQAMLNWCYPADADENRQVETRSFTP